MYNNNLRLLLLFKIVIKLYNELIESLLMYFYLIWYTGHSMWGQSGENYLLAMLQRSPSALTQIAKTFSESGTSEARFTLDGSTFASLEEHLTNKEMKCIRQHAMDVGILCKACQTLYGNEAAIVQHQHAGCAASQQAESSGHMQGATRLTLLQYECQVCEEKLPTLSEVVNHFTGEQHRRCAARSASKNRSSTAAAMAGVTSAGFNGDSGETAADNGRSPTASPSAGLNSQIEDVVKQLTALAQATSGQPIAAFASHNKNTDCDTNANIARKAATYGQ